MSISRSRSRSLRLSVSRKRKASRSASYSRSVGSFMPRGTNHSGNLPMIGKPLRVSRKEEKIANSILSKLTLPIEVVNDYVGQKAVAGGLQVLESVFNVYTPGDIANILYYAAYKDQSGFLQGTKASSDAPGTPYKVQCLGAESSINFTNVTNMDSNIDIYVVEPRRDIYKHLEADGYVTDMIDFDSYIQNEGYNQTPLEHTTAASTLKNLLYTDPRCSLFDRHGFLKDFKIIKANTFVLAGGESRVFTHSDKRRIVFDSQIHADNPMKQVVALRGISQFIVARIRGGLVTDLSALTHQGVGPTKINMVKMQKFIFKRIKIAQRQQIYEATNLSNISNLNASNVDPENSVLESYLQL